ncbi:juvenile hormone acid O-methyltransferase-like isoform X2 [Ornithodoros turicata]|uniref:juvenile hormone acid O-methyltransferase-like isoform X2 n=1 Tax=Ornithodoros turicata TaxID=34597 RepID=UPI0031389426
MSSRKTHVSIQPTMSEDDEVAPRPTLAQEVFIMPELYQGRNSVQHALNTLDLRWLNDGFREDDGRQQYLDVGCASGCFTRDFLLEKCAPCKRLVAVDISHDMISYAREHYSHPKITYEVLDIAGDVCGFTHRYGKFRRVYSFFALHWVKDQVGALRNIAALMTPDGECLLKFVGRSPAFEVWLQLARRQRWSSCAKILTESVPNSHYAEDQRTYIEMLLRQTRLRPHTCEALRQEISLSVDRMREMFSALLPVSKGMSPSEKEDMLDDFVSAMVTICGGESKEAVAIQEIHYLVHASKCSDLLQPVQF